MLFQLLYHHPVKKRIDVQRITLGSVMYIKALFPKSMQHYKLTTSAKENENYDCKLNCKIKQKSKTILGRIQNLVIDFNLYLVTAYII